MKVEKERELILVEEEGGEFFIFRLYGFYLGFSRIFLEVLSIASG